MGCFRLNKYNRLYYIYTAVSLFDIAVDSSHIVDLTLHGYTW